MRRRIIMALGAGALAVGAGIFVARETGLMTTFETNANCRLLDQASFDAEVAELATYTAARPAGGQRLDLSLDYGLPVRAEDTLILWLGTTRGLSEVEYIGPALDSVTLLLEMAPEETSLPIFPMVTLIHPARRAICTWATDEGLDFTGPARWSIRLDGRAGGLFGGDSGPMGGGLTLRVQ